MSPKAPTQIKGLLFVPVGGSTWDKRPNPFIPVGNTNLDKRTLFVPVGVTNPDKRPLHVIVQKKVILY